MFEFIFYGTGILALVFFLICLARFLSARRAEKREPGSVPERDLKARKIWLILASVIFGVIALFIVSIMILISLVMLSM